MLRKTLTRVSASTSSLRFAKRYVSGVTASISTGTSAKIMQAFQANAGLHFKTENEFQRSPLRGNLTKFLQAQYRLSPYSSQPLQTCPMPVALELLGLTDTYKQFIDPNKYFIGVHGAGAGSIAAMIPSLNGIKPMATFHNPFHTKGGAPLFFFYGSNIEMMLHYGKLNSVTAEVIDGNSHPDFFPAQIGVLGFADKEVVEKINQANSDIPVAQTQASIKKSYHKMPEDHHIGNEIRLPKPYHGLTLNLPMSSILGSQRLSSLTSGFFYVDGKPHLWKKGVGLVDEQALVADKVAPSKS